MYPINSGLFFQESSEESKERHYEREKKYMESMQRQGCVVGEYIGNGHGELEESTQVPTTADLDAEVIDADPGVGIDDQSDDDEANCNGDPLLILYDCETTGLSICIEHITDIAAKVIASPVPLATPTFDSLVKTSRRIPAAGTRM